MTAFDKNYTKIILMQAPFKINQEKGTSQWTEDGRDFEGASVTKTEAYRQLDDVVGGELKVM